MVRSGIVLFTLAAFTTVGCGNGLSPQSCGSVKSGEQCAESADCNCRLECIDSACATVFTVQPPAESTPTHSSTPSSTVKTICDRQKALSACQEGEEDFDYNQCLASGTAGEEDAKKAEEERLDKKRVELAALQDTVEKAKLQMEADAKAI